MFTLGLLKPNAITDEIIDAAVQLTNPFDSCINIHHRIVPPLTERMKKTFNFSILFNGTHALTHENAERF